MSCVRGQRVSNSKRGMEKEGKILYILSKFHSKRLNILERRGKENVYEDRGSQRSNGISKQ